MGVRPPPEVGSLSSTDRGSLQAGVGPDIFLTTVLVHDKNRIRHVGSLKWSEGGRG
jgi:hypothetical protein